jgi:hypothetical protein
VIATEQPNQVIWQGFGLRIRSAFALPGAVQANDSDREPDIEIVQGAPPPWDETRVSGPYRSASADLFEFTMPTVARFACLDRRRILVDPAPDVDPMQLSEMLIATVLPALLWARCEITLHASAFVLDGGTQGVAVAGASGSGKSTALARALAMGAGQVADDAICLRMQDDAVTVSGLAGGYFERMRGREGRIFRPTPGQQCRSACLLGALLVLTPSGGPARRLSGMEAIQALLVHRHRPRIASLLGIEAALLPTMASIARSMPIIAVPRASIESTGWRDAAIPVKEAGGGR